jgi:predicted transcriptional regulator
MHLFSYASTNRNYSNVLGQFVNEVFVFVSVNTEKQRAQILNEVAKILGEEREAKGLSMTYLAERSGLSRAMISFVEKNHRNPTLDTLLRMTDVLEIDVTVLIRRAQKRARTN